MCDPATIGLIITGVAGAGGVAASVQGAHQERKAAKSKAAGERAAAEDKIIADKEAKVTKQESLASGQVQGVDAANALKALGSATQTGAAKTIGAGNVSRGSLIGE